jgi:hypothetical protein
MVGAKVRTTFDGKKLRNAVAKGNITSLGHAGAAIRLQARRSIKKAKGASSPGSPPHTRKGRLRNAIKYAVTGGKQSVVIGPDAEVAGTSGTAHEFGGAYKRERYTKRPFMGPALEQVQDRLPPMWEGSVK